MKKMKKIFKAIVCLILIFNFFITPVFAGQIYNYTASDDGILYSKYYKVDELIPYTLYHKTNDEYEKKLISIRMDYRFELVGSNTLEIKFKLEPELISKLSDKNDMHYDEFEKDENNIRFSFFYLKKNYSGEITNTLLDVECLGNNYYKASFDIPDEFFEDGPEFELETELFVKNHYIDIDYINIKRIDGELYFVEEVVVDAEKYDYSISVISMYHCPGYALNSFIDSSSESLDSVIKEINSAYNVDLLNLEPIEQVYYFSKWTKDNISYDIDYFRAHMNNEPLPICYTRTKDVLKYRKTICQGYASLASDFLNYIGIPTYYVTGDTEGGGHAWNFIMIDGFWLSYEPQNGQMWDLYDLSKLKDRTPDYFEGIIYEGYYLAYPSEWAIEELNKSLKSKIIPYEIYCDYTDNMSRLEFCKSIMSMLKKSLNISDDEIIENKNIIIDTSKFSDTQDKDVLLANALGIVNGKGNFFDPNGDITRQEIAAIFSRLNNILNIENTSNPEISFKDHNDIADWAKDGVKFVSSCYDLISKKKVMGGKENNSFAPKAPITKEEAIIAIFRLFNAIK